MLSGRGLGVSARRAFQDKGPLEPKPHGVTAPSMLRTKSLMELGSQERKKTRQETREKGTKPNMASLEGHQQDFGFQLSAT